MRGTGHFERRNVESLTTRVREKAIVRNVRRGRPKKSGEKTMKDDMKKRNLRPEDAKDREKWRHCWRTGRCR